MNHVEAVLPYLPLEVADMLRLQLLTAMRPSEVCNMRRSDIQPHVTHPGKNWVKMHLKTGLFV
ncbi:MAG: hypothetical protein LBJ67_07130 [Planctomycetaceae bacterium]|nr:hypothetical protein [Planctomycetaceae bacterium]